MPELFISYKAEDRARLKALISALQAIGLSVWWDAKIGGGSDWRSEIQERLDEAQCVLVAWSERSVGTDGGFVRDEASRAQKRGTYLPLLLDEVTPPLGFGEVQAISLVGWRGNRRDPRFLQLVDGIQHRLRLQKAPSPAMRTQDRPLVTRRTILVGTLGASTLAVAGGWALLRTKNTGALNRIAVMSFANLSGDTGQAYFADGIAEELRNALSRLGIQVIGRASCDAVKDLSIQDAARKLGVDNVLTGSVRRTSQTIRINAQLVGARDGVERWAQSYDRRPGDAISIQTDIAQQVATALSVALGSAQRAALKLGATGDSTAQDLYLQSQQALRDGDGASSWQRQVMLLDSALARDPNYGDAWLGKAYALVGIAIQYAPTAGALAQGLSSAESAARRAATVMRGSGRPAAMLSEISASRLHFVECLQLIRQALEIGSNDAYVLARVVKNLNWLGDNNEALTLADRAIALDPLNAVNYTGRARCLISLRRYDEAIVAARHAIALNPNGYGPYTVIAGALLRLNRTGEVEPVLAKVPADNAFRQLAEGLLAAHLHDRKRAEAVISKMRSAVGDNASYQYAEIYAQLGDTDRAFAALDRAADVKDPGLLVLKRDSNLDPIRGDRRFAALLQRLNYP